MDCRLPLVVRKSIHAIKRPSIISTGTPKTEERRKNKIGKMNTMKINEIIKIWSRNIKDELDTGYSVTLSFRQFNGKNITDTLAINTTKFFLKKLSKLYFGKNPHRKHFNGYLFLEHQENGNPHLHILIENHEIFQRTDKNFNDTVIKSCKNLYTISEHVGIDIQSYYAGTLEEYLFKTARDKNNFEFVQPFGRDDFLTGKRYWKKNENQFEMCSAFCA